MIPFQIQALTRTSPPSTYSAGHAYLINGAGAGAWAGHGPDEWAIALTDSTVGGVWVFSEVQPGFVFHDVNIGTEMIVTNTGSVFKTLLAYNSGELADGHIVVFSGDCWINRENHHHFLDGNEDDDHPQYVVGDNTRATTGAITFNYIEHGHLSGSGGEATATIDWNESLKQQGTVIHSPTDISFVDPIDACSLTLRIDNDNATGSISWPTGVLWPAGTTGAVSAEAGTVDIFSFFFDGTTYHGQVAKDFS